MQGTKIIALLALALLITASFGQNVPCDVCGKSNLILYSNQSTGSTIIKVNATYINVSSTETIDPAKYQQDKNALTIMNNQGSHASGYSFAVFDFLPLAGETLHFKFDDFGDSGVYVPNCQDVAVGPDGMASCTISSADLAGKCRVVYAIYGGNNNTNPKLLPGSASLLVCDMNSLGVNAIGASITTLVSNNVLACFPLSLILGLLLASMYYSGRNPLSLFDITTPKMPKGKKAKMHKVTVGTNLLMALRLNKRQIKETTAALRLANARLASLLAKNAKMTNMVNRVMQSNLSDAAKSALLRRIAAGKVNESTLDMLIRRLMGKMGLSSLNRERYLGQLAGVENEELRKALLHSADLSGVLTSHLLTQKQYAKAYGFDKIGGKLVYGDKNILGKVPLVNKVMLYTASAIASRRSVHGMKKDIRRQFAVEIAERMGLKNVLGKKDHYLAGVLTGKSLNPFEWVAVDGRSFKTRKIADAKDVKLDMQRKINDEVKAGKDALLLAALEQLSAKRNSLLEAERAKLEGQRKDLKSQLASGALSQSSYERAVRAINARLADEKQLIAHMRPADRARFMSEEKNILDAQRQAYLSAVSGSAALKDLKKIDGEFAALYSQLAGAKTISAQKEAMAAIDKKMDSFMGKTTSIGSGLDIGKVVLGIASSLPGGKLTTRSGGTVDIAKSLKVLDNFLTASSSKNFDEMLDIDKKLSNMLKGFSNRFSFLFGEDVKTVVTSNARDRDILDKVFNANMPKADKKALEAEVKKLIQQQYSEAMSGRTKSGIATMMMDEVAIQMKKGMDYNKALAEASGKVFDRLNKALPTAKDFASQGFISGHGAVTNKYFRSLVLDQSTLNPTELALVAQQAKTSNYYKGLVIDPSKLDSKEFSRFTERALRNAMLDHMSDRIVGILDSHKQNLYKRLDSTREFHAGIYNGYKDWFNQYGSKDDRFKGLNFDQAYSELMKKGITGGMTRNGIWVGDLDMKMMPYFKGMSVGEGDKIINGKVYINVDGKMEAYKPYKREHDRALGKLEEEVRQFAAKLDNGAFKTDNEIRTLNLKDRNGNAITTIADFNKLARTEKLAAFTPSRIEIREKAPQMGSSNALTKRLSQIGLFAESVMIGGIANKSRQMQESFATQAANRVILRQYKDNFDAGMYLPRADFNLKSETGKGFITKGVDAHVLLEGLKDKIAQTDEKKLARDLVKLQADYSTAANPQDKAKYEKLLNEKREQIHQYNRAYDDLRTVQKEIKNTSYYDDFLASRKMGRQFSSFYNVFEASQMRDPRFGSSSYGMYQMLATGYHTGQGMYENPNIILGHNLLPGDFINKMSLKVTMPLTKIFAQHTRPFFSLAVGYPVVSDMAQARKPAYGEAVRSLFTPWESFDRLSRYTTPRMRKWSEFDTEEGFSLWDRSIGGSKFKFPLPVTFQAFQGKYGDESEKKSRRLAKDYEADYGKDIQNKDAPWTKWFFEPGYYSYINRTGHTYFQSGGSMRHFEMFKGHYQNVNKLGPPGMFVKDFETDADHMHPRIAGTLAANKELSVYGNLYYKNENANLNKDMTADIWRRENLGETFLARREHELAGFGMRGRFRPIAFAVPLLWPVFAARDAYDHAKSEVEDDTTGKKTMAGVLGRKAGKTALAVASLPVAHVGIVAKPIADIVTKGTHKKYMDRTQTHCGNCGTVLPKGTATCPKCGYRQV